MPVVLAGFEVDADAWGVGHLIGRLLGWLKPAGRAGCLAFGLAVLRAGWVAGGPVVRGEEGEVLSGDLSEDFDDVLRCGCGGGVVEL